MQWISIELMRLQSLHLQLQKVQPEPLHRLGVHSVGGWLDS